MQSPAASRRVAALGLLAGPLGAAALWLLDGAGAWQTRLPAPSWGAAFLLLLAAPVLEELAFRGALQDLCRAVLRRLGLADAKLVSGSNLVTSIAFAACHLRDQPAAMACAIMLPSLFLGRLREVSSSVFACVLMHAWFNACFLACWAITFR